MRVDTWLATLDFVRSQLDLGTTETGDDDKLRVAIGAASSMIAAACGRQFVPYAATRQYDAIGAHIDGATLFVGEDLLAVSALTNGDGTALASSAYVLRPSNATPSFAVELKASAATSWLYTDDWQQAISITGTWGYHGDWSNAWIDTGETVEAGGIDASTTTLTLSDADGYDDRYRTRAQVGMLLKVDDEYMSIQAVNTTSNEITVIRGVRGTTAASHDAGTAIMSYAVPREIEMAASQLAVWLYRVAPTAGDKLQFVDGVLLVPSGAPDNVAATVARYRRHL